jgi:hypothetical protein
MPLSELGYYMTTYAVSAAAVVPVAQAAYAFDVVDSLHGEPGAGAKTQD